MGERVWEGTPKTLAKTVFLRSAGRQVAERGFLYAMPWKANDLPPVSQAERVVQGILHKASGEMDLQEFIFLSDEATANVLRGWA